MKKTERCEKICNDICNLNDTKLLNTWSTGDQFEEFDRILEFIYECKYSIYIYMLRKKSKCFLMFE